MKMNNRSVVRSTLRQRQRDEVARVIVQAAESLMVSKPFGEISMRELASAAGCALGTLYRYFPNKEALFRAIEERHVVASLAEATQGAQTETKPLAALRAATAAFLEYARKNRAVFAVYFTSEHASVPCAALESPFPEGPAQDAYLAYRQREHDLILAAQRDGSITSQLDATVLQDFQQTVFMGLLSRFVLMPSPSPTQHFLDTYWDLVCHGMNTKENPCA